MTSLDLAAWCAALFLAANLFPHTVALRLTLLVLGLAFVGLELARAKRPLDLRVLPPLLVPILLWAAWAALSIKWSLDPERSVKEFKNEIGYVFVAFWLCYVAAQAPIATRVFSGVVGVGATVASAIGLYVFFSPASRLITLGIHNGPGDQTSALLTLMPGALIWAWLAKQSHFARGARWASLLLPILFCASAYSTLNRTIWVGFAAQVVILGTFLWRRRAPKDVNQSRWVLRLATLGAIGVLAVGVAMTIFVQKERTEHGWAPAFGHDLRLKLWPDVLDKIRERPLTGYGFGRGAIRESLHEELRDEPHAGALWHAHNLFLEIAAELGLPGVAFLVLLLATTLREGWRLTRNANEVASLCGIAVIAVLVGMLIRNMTDMLWVRQNSLLYWGVVGTLLAWGHVHADKRH